jgi:hypothetical protein
VNSQPDWTDEWGAETLKRISHQTSGHPPAAALDHNLDSGFSFDQVKSKS